VTGRRNGRGPGPQSEDDDDAEAADHAAGRSRLDKWLWCARFVKSRSLAAQLVASGAVRLGGAAMAKPSHKVKVGDILTFSLGGRVCAVKVLACAERRGPAIEARRLYLDLDFDEAPISVETCP
jgi:ribosome-associated heat shock protein Hsp15